jgi:hypothetical protein
MPHLTEPVILEPRVNRRRANPLRGDFLLYDTDFELETSERYAVSEGDPLRLPHFSQGEVAAWVFGKNAEWLRHRIKGKPWRNKTASGYTPLQYKPLLLQGKPLEFRQVKGRGATSKERRLTLADCERLAWALYESNDIDGVTLQRASEVLIAVAQLYIKESEREND